MTIKNPINGILFELKTGMNLAKCRECGCMKETLENLQTSLSSGQIINSSNLVKNIQHWLKQMDTIKYTCLGCTHCYPAVATNIFTQSFPELVQLPSLSCGSEVREQAWPPVPGEYFASCDGPSCPVAVSTLSSVELAEKIADKKPKELCIVGKTETENIGIDKVIKNIITNPTIRFLILAGKDPEGHRSGGTLLSLWKNGVDENMRIINSPGRRPILRNVSRQEVETFRKQVQVIDMIGREDENRVIEKIKELSQEVILSCSCDECVRDSRSIQVLTTPVINAQGFDKVEMDKTGYFVIIPQSEKSIIVVEHYSYDNKLLRIIKGKDARNIYLTIIKNGWVTHLSHAAYLGKELMKAEISIKFGLKYIQDGV